MEEISIMTADNRSP